MHPMSGSSSSGNSRVVFSTFSHTGPTSAQHHPMISHLNQLINTLNEAPQDLMKFQALKVYSIIFANSHIFRKSMKIWMIFMELLHIIHLQII